MTAPPGNSSHIRRETLTVAGRPVPVRLVANARARRVILKVDPVTREIVLTSPTARGFDKALAFARTQESWIADRLGALPAPVPFVHGAAIPVRGAVHEIVHDRSAPARQRVQVRVRTEPTFAAMTTDLPLSGSADAQPVAAPARLIVAGEAAHVSRRVSDWLKREARADLTAATLAHASAFGVRPARIALRDTASRWGSCSTTRVISFSWRLIFAPPAALDYVAAHEAAHLVEHNHGARFWSLVRSRIADIDSPVAWLKANGHSLHRYGASPK